MINMIQQDNIQPQWGFPHEPPSQIPYGVKMIGADLEWTETKGKGIKVAVLDTGRPSHRDLKVIESANFTTDSSDLDRHGHASHCAGIVCANGDTFGVAPEAELYAVKVLNDRGQGQDGWIANGINWCISKNIDIINLSLGSSQPIPLTHAAIKRAEAKGIIVVTSAGNSGLHGVSYPAIYPETIAVAAVDITKNWSSYSSVGNTVEVAAAGTEIWSCYPNSIDRQFPHGRYAKMSGTSMACPHIVGAIALFQAKSIIRFGRKLTKDEIRLLLHTYAEDLGESGKDDKFGFGLFSFGRFNKIKMQLNNKNYSINGENKVMDVPPMAHNGRTLVPVRVIAEGLKCNVDWIPETKEIIITG